MPIHQRHADAQRLGHLSRHHDGTPRNRLRAAMPKAKRDSPNPNTATIFLPRSGSVVGSAKSCNPTRPSPTQPDPTHPPDFGMGFAQKKYPKPSHPSPKLTTVQHVWASWLQYVKLSQHSKLDAPKCGTVTNLTNWKLHNVKLSQNSRVGSPKCDIIAKLKG